jgi:heme oxygenase (biliverdin-producing, ferredoxin)
MGDGFDVPAGHMNMGASRSNAGTGAASLMDAIRDRTRALHTEAERSGVLGELLQGRANRRSYAALLRNLLPVYRELESGLERHRDSAGTGRAAQPAVYRSAALESDLAAVCGPDWQRDLAIVPAAERYAAAVAAAAASDGSRLIAHAYVRYLGDLSGGRILRAIVARSLSLDATQLAFYDYPGGENVDALKTTYRAALDRAAAHAHDPAGVIAEAEHAFRLNIDLSVAVAATNR